jgi:hypothetical protein
MTSSGPAELIIIGTLHGGHNTARHYTPEALLRILLALRPHRFCAEAEGHHIGEDGYARPPADPEAERVWMPDGWALEEASRELQVRLLPFEWEGYGKRLRETRLIERSDTATAQFEQLLAELTATDPACLECQLAQIVERADQCQTILGQHAAPETINSDAFDHVVRIKHSFPNTLLPLLAKRDDHEKYAEMVAGFRFIFEDWQERNDAMASNLARICAERPGRRLVVVTGAEHRYALRDRLAGRAGVVLKEFWEVLEPGWSTATDPR